MSVGPKVMRLIAVLVVLTSLATACRATATAVPSGAVESADAAFGDATSPAIGDTAQDATEVTFTFDPRIDPRLTRSDIDCSPAAFNGYENGRIVSAYYVVDGQLGANCFGQENVLVVEAWKVLVSVSPADHLRHMGLMTGYVNELDIPAQGSAVGLASDTGWATAGARISVDLDYAFIAGQNLSIVLAHEMAHVLAGARSQTTTDFESTCEGFFYRRCFKADSMFVEFAALFWLDYFPSFDPGSGPSADQARQLCARDGGFFTAYAATDPFEDFAESYTTYVHGFEPLTPGQQARHDWFAAQSALTPARDRAAVLRPEFGRTWPQQCGL